MTNKTELMMTAHKCACPNCKLRGKKLAKLEAKMKSAHWIVGESQQESSRLKDEIIERQASIVKLELALKIEKEWSENCKKELADAKEVQAELFKQLADERKEHGCAVIGAKIVCQHLGEKLCEALKENEALKKQNAELRRAKGKSTSLHLNEIAIGCGISRCAVLGVLTYLEDKGVISSRMVRVNYSEKGVQKWMRKYEQGKSEKTVAEKQIEMFRKGKSEKEKEAVRK